MSALAQRLPVARYANSVWDGLITLITRRNASGSKLSNQLRFLPGTTPKILIYLARNRDAGLPQHMSDLRVPQARRVIFKRQPVLAVYAKFAQAVGIREFTEPAQLRQAQGRLQLIGNFEECHGNDYTSLLYRRGVPEWYRQTSIIVSYPGTFSCRTLHFPICPFCPRRQKKKIPFAE